MFKRQSAATASDGKVDVPNRKAKWKQEYNEKRKEDPSKELIRKWLSKYGWLICALTTETGRVEPPSILSMVRAWQEDIFPLVVLLYEFLLSLPMSSVDCERGFSIMNMCKTS